jgi:hypothetical protein
MVCSACGEESSNEFTFCPHCGKQKATRMVCPSCARESVAEFSFCPHCGKAFAPAPPVIEPPTARLEVEAAKLEHTDQQEPIKGSENDRSNKIGTYVFGAFAILTLFGTAIKGFVPFDLMESAAWAGAAWYWHKKKTHSELAKAIVIVFAAFVVIGDVIVVTRQFRSESKQTLASTPNPFDSAFTSQSESTYPSPAPASAEALPAPNVAETEQQAVVLYKQKRYADAKSLFNQACNGGEMKACNYLGYLYAQGLGGPHDRKKAQDVYQRACEQGTLSSCASLGSLYQDAGDGDNARKYFQKACDGGVSEGCDLLRRLQ